MEKIPFVEKPAGQAKTVDSVKTFDGDGSRTTVSFKKEERCFGDVRIVEEEKTRIYKSESITYIVKVNITDENGVIKKIIEGAFAEVKDNRINTKRRRKTYSRGKLLSDETMLKEEDAELLKDAGSVFDRRGNLCVNRFK